MLPSIMISRIFSVALGAFLVSPVCAYAQNVQLQVSAVVPAGSNFASTVQKVRPAALEVARRNAWLSMKMRSEFQKVVFNFEPSQDEEMASRLEQLCSPPVDAGQNFDRKLKLLTFQFVFSCNQQALVRDASRLNSILAKSVDRVPRARLTGIFIALKTDQIEEFDAISKSSRERTRKGTIAGEFSMTQQDDEKRNEARSSDESLIEEEGRTTELSSDKQRTQGATSAGGGGSISVTQSTRVESQRGNSRVRRAAKESRVVVSAQEIQRALVPILQRDRFAFVPYGTVSSRCNGVPFEEIQDEIRNLPADMPLALRDSTRDKVLQVVAHCQISSGTSIRYYVEGYAKIGAPSIDGGTGEIKVSVNVSQSIFDAETGEEVSTTPEQQVYGIGEDEAVATSNALNEAAELVGQTTVANLSGLGI